MLGPSYIADFSSRGPTQDGRSVPHVVAPGKYMLSAASRPDIVGECDATGNVPSPGEGSGGLVSMAGTSMSAPVVSGMAALIRQYFEEGYYPAGRKGEGTAFGPSAAVVKAVIINGAQVNMNGVDNIGRVTGVAPYDNTMGFGRVDLLTSLYLDGWSYVQVKVWDESLQIGIQEEKAYVIKIDKSGGCAFPDLSVTLVWVERASVVGCARCVLNDLDLTVTRSGDGTVYHPNGLTSPDRINNAERVVVTGASDGEEFVATVRAHNLDDDVQKFALVSTGCFGGTISALSDSVDVFDDDDPPMSRTRIFLIVVCSVVAVIIVAILGTYCFQMAKDRKANQGGGGGGGTVLTE